MSDKENGWLHNFYSAFSEITMISFIINKDLEPSAILGPPFINQLIRCVSILLKTRVNRKNRDGRIDLRIFKFWILWLAAVSPQELCIRFLSVTVCVMA